MLKRSQRFGVFNGFLVELMLCSDPDECALETTHMILMVGCLSMAIILVICTFNFIREEKEDPREATPHPDNS
eukprot:4857050-Amphidinium_carterae.1